MYKKAFTIVEVLVVVTVIVIIIAMGVNAYSQYQNRAVDGEIRGLAALVKSASDRYYSTNNEYVSATTLYGGTPSPTTPPASYTTISQTLGIPSTTLNRPASKLQPCSGTNCATITSPDKKKVFYFTKAVSGSAENYTISGCTLTFPANEPTGRAFFLAYYSSQKATWYYAKSTRGTVTTSNTTTCPFTAL